MLQERFEEILDFIKEESPYRSATKGWITNDIYLKTGPSSDENKSDFGQLAKVSIFWKPIFQIAIVLFLLISFSTLVAFTPLAFSKGKFNTLNSLFHQKPLLEEQISTLPSSKVEELPIQYIEKEDLKENENQKIPFNKNISINKVTLQQRSPRVTNNRKLITATDLFQPRHG